MLPMESLLRPDKNEPSCGFRKPTEIGRFSLDESRHFHHDRSQMTCFCKPADSWQLTQNMNLNDGYNTPRSIKRNEDIKERLNHMLEWMLYNKKRFVFDVNSKEERDEKLHKQLKVIGEFPDFLLWRGHLTKFMCSAYENRDGWIMACQKLGNTIYISEVESNISAQKRKNRTDREDLMTYWGVRFEGYMTGPFPKPGSSAHCCKDQANTIINTNKAFCSVFRSRLNNRHSLVYGGEVDCCQPVEILNPPDCYVELKTSRNFTHQKQKENFYRYKALKWWAQSYLAGIPQITCGFRDDDGFVTSIQDFSTFDLPTGAMSLRNSWDQSVCLTFLDNLLQAIKDLFKEIPSVEHVLILTWNPGDLGVSYKISQAPADRFLHNWYIKETMK